MRQFPGEDVAQIDDDARNAALADGDIQPRLTHIVWKGQRLDARLRRTKAIGVFALRFFDLFRLIADLIDCVSEEDQAVFV